MKILKIIIAVAICILVVSSLVVINQLTYSKKEGTLRYEGLWPDGMPGDLFAFNYDLLDVNGHYIRSFTYKDGSDYNRDTGTYVHWYQPTAGPVYYYQSIFGMISNRFDVR